jgi:hypothetical protein
MGGNEASDALRVSFRVPLHTGLSRHKRIPNKLE